MQIKVITFCLISLFMNSGFGQGPARVPGAKEVADRWKDAQTLYDKGMKEATEAYKRQNAAVAKVEAEVGPKLAAVEAQIKQIESEGLGAFGAYLGVVPKPKVWQDLKAKAEELRGQIKVETDKMAAVQGKYEEFANALTTVDESRTRDLTAVGQQISSLQTAVRLGNIHQKFSELKSRVSDVNEILNTVGQKYDQTVLGAYIKDKIGQFATSGLACDMVKACGPEGSGRLPVAKLKSGLDSIFPNMKDSTRTKAPAAPTAPPAK